MPPLTIDSQGLLIANGDGLLVTECNPVDCVNCGPGVMPTAWSVVWQLDLPVWQPGYEVFGDCGSRRCQDGVFLGELFGSEIATGGCNGAGVFRNMGRITWNGTYCQGYPECIGHRDYRLNKAVSVALSFAWDGADLYCKATIASSPGMRTTVCYATGCDTGVCAGHVEQDAGGVSQGGDPWGGNDPHWFYLGRMLQECPLPSGAYSGGAPLMDMFTNECGEQYGTPGGSIFVESRRTR